MNPRHHDRNEPDGLSARDAWLTAYLDGELPPEQSRRVESWLDRDPAARIEFEDMLQLGEWMDETSPATPSAEAFADALDTIAAAALPPPRRRSRSGGIFFWISAAAVLFAAVWTGLHFRESPTTPIADRDPSDDNGAFAVLAETELVIDDMDPFDAPLLLRGRVPSTAPAEMYVSRPLEVAGVDQVAVVSMDGNDVDVLIVARPPVWGPLLPARRGEVKVDHIAAFGNDEKPWLSDKADGMPMLMMPSRSARRD